MFDNLIRRIKNKIVHELTKEEQRLKRDKLIKSPPLTDDYYLLDDVVPPVKMSHTEWFRNLVEKFNHESVSILEVGSREVTASSKARKAFSNANYVGFDYYPGNNVDVVGDVHKLSSYFDKQFDLIYCSACFEHFAMPWVAATEINKLLKKGGHLFIETHFSFRSHERPWNFFQFSDLGLEVLFSESMGYECIDKGMSNPIVGRFSQYADEYLKHIPIKGLYCHSEFYAVKIREIDNFDWNLVDMSDLVKKTEYPRVSVLH